MINRTTVITLAGALYGIETEGLSALCDAACTELEAKMKRNADPADTRIISLAAAMLFYRCVIRSAGAEDAVSSFKAGDVAVTLSRHEAKKTSLAEIERAKAAAAALLTDTDFYFGQVKYHIH